MTEKWRLIVAFLKAHKWRVGGTLGLGIISSILTVIIPISIGKFYGLLFSYQSHRAKLLDFLPSWFFDTFTSFFIFFATAVLLRFVIN